MYQNTETEYRNAVAILERENQELRAKIKILEDPEAAHRLWIVRTAHRNFQEAKKRSRKTGTAFEITLSHIDELLDRNPEHCSLTGLKFQTRQDKHSRNPYAPSIDRIDSSVGYVPGNIRIVAYCVNCAMNEWGEEVFQEMCFAYSQINKL